MGLPKARGSPTQLPCWLDAIGLTPTFAGPQSDVHGGPHTMYKRLKVIDQANY